MGGYSNLVSIKAFVFRPAYLFDKILMLEQGTFFIFEMAERLRISACRLFELSRTVAERV